jgi:hypothetical protein
MYRVKWHPMIWDFLNFYGSISRDLARYQANYFMSILLIICTIFKFW